jgi:hypothetical protein
MKMNLVRLFLAVISAAAFSGIAAAQDCDIAILGERVMDPETKFDAVSNVCVADLVHAMRLISV